MNQSLVGYVTFAGSLALHGLAVTRSAGAPAARPLETQPSFVEFTAPEPLPEPPPEPPPPPEPEPEPPAKPSPPERLHTPPPASEPAAAPAPTAEPSEPPPALTGVTLTGDGDSSFTTPEGNGAARDGAVVAGAPSRRTHAATPAVAPAPRPAAPPPALPLSQLSRRPVPPPLGTALERNYPREARNLGKSGDAKVRARVEANGDVRSATIVFATSPDFGEACRRTLLGSRWSAPLDKNGRAASTWVSYQCKFRVD